ncbi:hypothetical protein QYE76_041608 [Lolium multiflorum]|uniref:Uncharacterized protein n=1 Tax=Lolium multiflorum TaxID=4521 RepID=A0AAD8WU55_LOLMU|nr:hypothetical protein QYE76_041608 [Lolium multiflorum]
MARAHPMWLYSGPRDETRINAAELSEKELLDEVRRLTHFSQEDSIPLTSSHAPFDVDHPPTKNLINPDYLQDLPNDTFERGDSSVPVGSHTEGNASSEAEQADPINPEAIPIDPKSAANDISDTAGSMHDDDADHAAFVDAAAEEAEALPSKRSSGGFADEDDLWDLGEDFIEPPPKKSKIGAAPPDLAASEASAPATIPAAQMSTASSLSKGKNIPPAAAAAIPPSGKPDLQAVISSLESFASQYASLEVDNARLQKEVESSSSKLEGAIKIAAEAHAEIDVLKGELGELKRRLKDEETARLTAEARAMEKDDLLHQSSLALLSNPLLVPFSIIVFANIDSFADALLHTLSFSGAADIPAEALDEVPNNSPSNTLSMTLASHQLVHDLLQKGKGAMARIHLNIFPKISQDKTLGQLFDAFAVNTKEVIEVFKRTSRTYGALLAFQLMMGHGFKANIEEMSKELPRGPDGKFADLSTFKASDLTCARQLLELVEAKRSSAGPSLSNQTQAP